MRISSTLMRLPSLDMSSAETAVKMVTANVLLLSRVPIQGVRIWFRPSVPLLFVACLRFVVSFHMH